MVVVNGLYHQVTILDYEVSGIGEHRHGGGKTDRRSKGC